MPIPAIYFDECVDHGLLIRLRRRGYIVTTAQAEGIIGVSDAVQLAYATHHDWVIVSTNTGDFQKLHSMRRREALPHGGILLLPTGQLDRMEIRAAMLIDWIATMPEYRSMLFRWNDLQRRLIHGERIPGYSERRGAAGARPPGVTAATDAAGMGACYPCMGSSDGKRGMRWGSSRAARRFSSPS